MCHVCLLCLQTVQVSAMVLCYHQCYKYTCKHAHSTQSNSIHIAEVLFAVQSWISDFPVCSVSIFCKEIGSLAQLGSSHLWRPGATVFLCRIRWWQQQKTYPCRVTGGLFFPFLSIPYLRVGSTLMYCILKFSRISLTSKQSESSLYSPSGIDILLNI